MTTSLSGGEVKAAYPGLVTPIDDAVGLTFGSRWQ
jgi:hypothetical protein